jgi:hypothetical protein
MSSCRIRKATGKLSQDNQHEWNYLYNNAVERERESVNRTQFYTPVGSCSRFWNASNKLCSESTNALVRYEYENCHLVPEIRQPHAGERGSPPIKA